MILFVLLMMSSVNAFLPNFFSMMSTVYMIYPPPRLIYIIYIHVSLFDVFHPRRLFSRVFSLLCLLLLR